MYINNVGSVVLALANAPSLADGTLATVVDPVEVAKVQATQVSVISIWNCLGRISMGTLSCLFDEIPLIGGLGMLSDYAKTRFHINRVRPFFSFFKSLLTLQERSGSPFSSRSSSSPRNSLPK